MSADRYELLGQLGAGNFTAGVHLAQHRDLGRQVAVKLLALDHLTEREKLLTEARTMASLEPHDNVVQVIDAGDWDEHHVYLAVELCADGSLDDTCPPYGFDPFAPVNVWM